MKRIIYFATLFLITFQLSAQKKSPDFLIKKAMAEQTAAWNTGNIERYMETYWHNDSLMFIGKNGPTYGWNNTLKNYKKGYPDTAAMGKLDFELVRLQHLSSIYYSVVGKWHLKRTIGDLKGAFTLIFKKINNKWLIVQDHSS